VYAIKLAKGQSLVANLTSSLPLGRMQLWSPGTTHVGDTRAVIANRAARSTPVGGEQRLEFEAPRAGRYFLQVRVGNPTRERPVYDLSVAKPRSVA
jgi:hypothetical protein